MALSLVTIFWPQSKLLGQGEGGADGQVSHCEGTRIGHCWEEVLAWAQVIGDSSGVRTRAWAAVWTDHSKELIEV